MKNKHTYFTLFLLVFLACIPPIDFFLSIPPTDMWFIVILMAGFFSVYTIFLKVNRMIPLISIGVFILCFLCPSPLMAFTQYVPLVLSCYFYINCTKIENWNIIFKAVQALVILNVILVLMQMTGHDELLNFGLGKAINGYGLIGQTMQMGSMSTIMSAFLLPFSVINLLLPFGIAFLCHSTWTLFTVSIGCFILLNRRYKTVARIFTIICTCLFLVISFHQGKFNSNAAENGRIVVWEKSLHFAMQRPLTGWGVGTYKILFPALGLTKKHDIPYKSAHNWFIQLLFETGIPFTCFICWGLGRLLYRLYKARQIVCFAALTMMLCDGMVHFPDRMLQTVGLIICFLAYCEVKLRI